MPQEVGKRLKRAFARDQFWTEEQRWSFLAACSLSGTSAGPLEAFLWKRGQGSPYKAWRALSRSERKKAKRGLPGGAA